MIDETLLDRIIDIGSRKGASYIEARYQLNKGFSLSMRNGKILALSNYVEEGVGIRVLVDGSLGFASTNNLTIDGLYEAVERAVATAKSTSRLRKRPIELSEERLGTVKYSVDEKKPLEDFSVEDLLSLGRTTYEASQGAVRESKIPVMAFSANLELQEKLVVTSDGARVYSRVPRPYLSFNTVLYHPQKGTLQRHREFGASGGLEWIETWNPTKQVVEELPALERVLLEGVKPPSEKVDVIVGSEIVGLLVHESAGHPMEADRILGREAAQAGESYVKPEMIGEYRIGNKFATVIEDPTIPGSYGFYLFDDEGVPARPRYLYKEGVINEPLHNRHTARVFGTKSNAAARAMNYSSEPIIRMSNTYFKPGDMSFEELIEDIDLGVYLKSYMEWNIDDIRWNQRYVGLEAYLIRKGEIAGPVRNPVLEITTQGFYSNIKGVDKNLQFYPGTCGKGEPSQGVPVWFGGPNVRLTGIRLGVSPI